MYVFGYPKSGNTWLCYLLAYCLNTEYDDLDEPDIHPSDEYQRSFVKGGLAHCSYEKSIGKVLKTHSLELIANADNPPVVYMVRDGRDVMVSYYFYKKAHLRQSDWIAKLLNGQLIRDKLGFHKIGIHLEQLSFSRFVRQHASAWAHHVRVWSKRDVTAMVRYEDLHASTAETVANTLLKLGIRVGAEIVQQAVEIFSFEKLAKRQPGEEDKTSFFRKGIVKDWENHFSKGDLSFFRAEVGDVLELLGYEISD